jgi:hypothetical protein
LEANLLHLFCAIPGFGLQKPGFGLRQSGFSKTQVPDLLGRLA